MYKTKLTTKLAETINKLNATEFKRHFYSIKGWQGSHGAWTSPDRRS